MAETQPSNSKTNGINEQGDTYSEIDPWEEEDVLDTTGPTEEPVMRTEIQT